VAVIVILIVTNLVYCLLVGPLPNSSGRKRTGKDEENGGKKESPEQEQLQMASEEAKNDA
jgi:hypothetical protein